MKNGRINKRFALLAILCLLVMVFAVPVASAASYSKVYGQTQDKIRVRESASTNATIIDNIVKDACVYITSSKTSGSNTFVQIKYRASDSSIATGWVCQNDGKNTYVKVLSTDQAKTKFKVSGGNLPSKAVGTFTAAERKASAANSDNTYIRQNASGETVKRIQTELKALNYYTGSITGNAGEKTVAAIKSFQSKNGLTADGIAGPQTIAKIDAAYEKKFGSSSGSTSSSSSSGLKLNSEGTDVRNLQQDLTTLGYYWAQVTGHYGTQTETAVKRFQEENGLTPDGVAGTKTLSAIASAVAKKGGTSASSSSAGTTLKLNSQGTKVSQLQTNLKQLGYYYAEITGNFGEKTEAAVKAFQKAKGLTADGVAGTKTLDAITAAVNKAGGSTSSGTALKLGSTGDKVSDLQKDLTTLGYYYGDVTGRFGTLTQQAVTKFQKAKGLTADGIASDRTLSAIAAAVGSGSATGSSSGELAREGDNGQLVTEIQTMLKNLKYYYGSVTGHYGSLTKQAVRKFQDDNNITVDGVAGAKTIALLRSKSGTGSSSGSGTGSSVSVADSYGRITKDNVYLRKSYSTQSDAVASLSKGKLVRITNKYTVSSTTWYYITVDVGNYTYKGYVRSDMLEKISESEYDKDGGNIDTGDSEILGMIRVTGNNVALRKEAWNGAVVDRANIGDVFYYIDTVDGWFQTRSGYWISRDYVHVMTDQEIKDYGGSSADTSDTSYKRGDSGATVKWIQQSLNTLGYYDDNKTISGTYGKYTEEAVREFQRDHGLSADGVAGPRTIEEISKALSGSSSSGSATTTYNPIVYNVDWFVQAASYKNAGLVKGASIKVTDLRTGRSFNAKVQSIGNHADVEPATASDTAVLCGLYNVASAAQLKSQNKYQRRPMMVTTSKNTQFVCSIYAIPHGLNTISGNNFDGQFCLHFLNSKTHGGSTGNVAVNADHQNAIKEGVEILNKISGTTVSTTAP